MQQVARPLALDERTLVLAAAVSIDYDYFSQHSHGSGLLPHFLMPYPGIPPVPYPDGADGGGEEGVPPTEDGDAGRLNSFKLLEIFSESFQPFS